MDGWMDEWMKRGMDGGNGWMDGWVGGCRMDFKENEGGAGGRTEKETR